MVAAKTNGRRGNRQPLDELRQVAWPATQPHARAFEMRGRQMKGWLRVDAEGLRTKRQLERWVARGVAHARSLPPKH